MKKPSLLNLGLLGLAFCESPQFPECGLEEDVTTMESQLLRTIQDHFSTRYGGCRSEIFYRVKPVDSPQSIFEKNYTGFKIFSPDCDETTPEIPVCFWTAASFYNGALEYGFDVRAECVRSFVEMPEDLRVVVDNFENYMKTAGESTSLNLKGFH